MLAWKIVKAGGRATRSRTAFAVVAATLLVGGTATEASAKSRHHQHQAYHHHHNHHVARANSNHRAASTSEAAASSKSSSSNSSWRDANATAGRSFSGVASFYGNESGSKTASPLLPRRAAVRDAFNSIRARSA